MSKALLHHILTKRAQAAGSYTNAATAGQLAAGTAQAAGAGMKPGAFTNVGPTTPRAGRNLPPTPAMPATTAVLRQPPAVPAAAVPAPVKPFTTADARAAAPAAAPTYQR